MNRIIALRPQHIVTKRQSIRKVSQNIHRPHPPTYELKDRNLLYAKHIERACFIQC